MIYVCSIQRGISPHHSNNIPAQNHPAAPHLADLANYERKRRSEKEIARAAAERRDRSAVSRDAAVRDIDALRIPPHIARVSASIAAPPPTRKMSEPLLNGRLDVILFVSFLKIFKKNSIFWWQIVKADIYIFRARISIF